MKFNSAKEMVGWVRDRLLEQGRRCVYPGTNGPMLRSGDLRCALGFLIPDHVYTPKMDLMSVAELKRAAGLRWPLHLLQRMQEIHDMDDPADWKVEFDHLVEVS